MYIQIFLEEDIQTRMVHNNLLQYREYFLSHFVMIKLQADTTPMQRQTSSYFKLIF